MILDKFCSLTGCGQQSHLYLSILCICLSVCFSVYLYVCLSVCLSICLFVYLSVFLSFYLSICFYPSIVSIYLIYIFPFLAVCKSSSICLSLATCLICIRMSIYLYLHINLSTYFCDMRIKVLNGGSM